MTQATELKHELDALVETFGRLKQEMQRAIVGQTQVIEDVLIALIVGEHVLLEGVPGLGKTLLVRTLGRVGRLTFSRIQFTPDLMPADITGTNIVVDTPQGSREFAFQPGPIFANIVLADEINRATPKTQSALLEAMQERSVTMAGKTHSLAEPFLVLATQNPLEMEGTYPLPEAQLDRFFFKLLVEFPSAEELKSILNLTTDAPPTDVHQVCTPDALRRMKQAARQIPVAEEIMNRVVRLVMATHPDHAEATADVRQYVRYGASPRGGQALILGAKVRAVLDGRYNVSWEDVAGLACPSLRHRIGLNFEGQANNISSDDLIRALVRSLD